MRTTFTSLDDGDELKAFLLAEDIILTSAMKSWGDWKDINLNLAKSFGEETPGNFVYRRSQYFFLMRVEAQDSVCICCSTQIGARPVVVVDVKMRLKLQKPSIDVWTFSDCERYIALTVSENGRDAQKLYVYDFETDAFLSDVLEGLRFPEVAWAPDSQAFIYNRHYDDGKAGSGYAVLSHRLGTQQSQDKLVEDFRSIPEALPLPMRAFRSPVCFLFVMIGTDFRNRLSWRPADSMSAFKTIQDFGLGKTEPLFTSVTSQGWSTIARTTVAAERGRIVAFTISETLSTGVGDFVDVVPETSDVLGDVSANSDNIVFERSTFSGSRLTVLNRATGFRQPIEVPPCSYISCGREWHEQGGAFAMCYLPSGEIRLLQISTPGNVISHSLSSADVNLRFSVGLEHATASDGTSIPVTLCWFDDHVDFEKRAVLLHVYGGFGLSMMLGYNLFASAWMRCGGIYAIAHVRGGGELGTAWHEMGRGKNKKRTIDDFLACSEYLLSHAHAKKLACWGASHGGFVVTRAINDRPELFAAVIADVPVTDLLALNTQMNGRETIAEYAIDQQGLADMSPLLGIRKQRYPPILVITAHNDERVPAWHSYRYVSAQRQINPGNDLFLWHVQDGGHGGPSDKQMALREEAVKLRFLSHYLMSGD